MKYKNVHIQIKRIDKEIHVIEPPCNLSIDEIIS